jgi:hypothetical protein
MSILIMTVGTGRNRQDIAGALLFSVERHLPEKVVFFCSEKTAGQTLHLMEESLRTKGIPFQAVTLPDEDNVQGVYVKYLEHMRQCGSPQDMVIDFTSGTKAMTAALFAAARGYLGLDEFEQMISAVEFITL